MPNKDEWIITENHHKPIISKEKFAQVQEILNKNKAARNNKEKDLFYSFLKCANCGSSFTLRKVKNYEYYHCTSYVRNGSCTSHSIRKDKHKLIIDEEASKNVIKIFNDIIEGKTANEIANELNKKNVLTPALYKTKNNNIQVDKKWNVKITEAQHQ